MSTKKETFKSYDPAKVKEGRHKGKPTYEVQSVSEVTEP